MKMISGNGWEIRDCVPRDWPAQFAANDNIVQAHKSERWAESLKAIIGHHVREDFEILFEAKLRVIEATFALRLPEPSMVIAAFHQHADWTAVYVVPFADMDSTNGGTALPWDGKTIIPRVKLGQAIAMNGTTDHSITSNLSPFVRMAAIFFLKGA